MTETRTETHPPRQLHRVLRVRDGLAVTVGIVIGAGILGTPGLIAGYLGDPLLILAMWFFGGVVAGLTPCTSARRGSASWPSPGALSSSCAS